ncbi:helix-turn-helix domain-containing protein [Shewanella sp. D64]|uniref:winged helix-turn-helix domain-containing protein n=1 Tax=unclassified Shewanella TaxID=196818 RepID=UPI0022BA40DF|nr:MULTISPECIES: helix-turn-helix domain-containing protein [unclassified Shewanella]MEC4724380.1 helix-turn-helix domain-containing protein [Shewanella sp. D64]MEC4738892.1 helix-turn-helix domain-containing protein [Shewanella sp. E94]WBJ97671.1 helix-turn-helix domain-containing protein [Shewanella sp. MTB7]
MADLIKIGLYIVDMNTGIFYKDGDSNSKLLTNKQLKFIQLLCKNKGGLVNKEIIIQIVWGGATSPESLTQIVNKLRSIFDDKDKNILINHPGKGYSISFGELHPLQTDTDTMPLTTIPSINTNELYKTTLSKNDKISIVTIFFLVLMMLIQFLGFIYINKHETQIVRIFNSDITSLDEYNCSIKANKDILYCDKI